MSSAQEPINGASSEVRRIIERVLEVEKERLHMEKRRHINDDILKIVKEEVQ
jgi:hypothetical protein